MPVLFEEQGGILEPEKMIAAHVKVAQYHGAQVHTGTAYRHYGSAVRQYTVYFMYISTDEQRFMIDAQDRGVLPGGLLKVG
jgi:hypothetical protein